MLLLMVLEVLTSVPAAVRAQHRGSSTPEERSRAVQATNSLRTAPLSAANKSEREWITKWLIEIPDISVKVCISFLGDLGKGNDTYSAALVASMIANEAAFIIEHPD